MMPTGGFYFFNLMPEETNEVTGHGFYITIPMKIALDEELPPNAKILFGIIANLGNYRGYCFASNAYIAKFMNINPTTVSDWVNKLIQRGYLIRFDEVTKTGLERRLSIAEPFGETRRPPSEIPEDPLREKPKQNNISLINKVNKQKAIDATLFAIEPTLPYGNNFKTKWSEWLKFKKERKEKFTALTAEKQLKLLAAIGNEDNAIATIERSIENGWRGLFPYSNSAVNQLQPTKPRRFVE